MVCVRPSERLVFTVLQFLAVISSVFPQGINFGPGPARKQCRVAGTNSPGRCVNIKKCPSVQESYRRHRPTICYFRGVVPFVCCPLDPEPVDTFLVGGTTNPPDSAEKDTTTEKPPPPPPLTLGPITLPSTPIMDISHPDLDFECGKADPVNPIIFPKVRNGVEALLHQWPWAAILGYDDDEDGITWFCDGVLINRQWVLTAAHCVDTRMADVVRLGEHDLVKTTESPSEDLRVVETIFNPRYVVPENYHDLTLLKLERRVEFKRAIQPVCLPWNNTVGIPGANVTVVGWGALNFGGDQSVTLQEANLTVFDVQRCQQSYSRLSDYETNFPRGIGTELLCIGDPQGLGRDACQGDSGGPVVYAEHKHGTLAGIVSTGFGCGDPDFPGIYASLHYAPDLAWVKQVAFS
ncbi:venom protease-like [Oratosquilla oratoria]|uniref:venom protease-like n=1 Tax=Oratosquilla oratoria TaxID=337810 RepID=UPI003F7751E6